MNPTDPLLKTAEALMKTKVHPTSVFILTLLLEGKKHITKIAERADLTTNAITYHLLKMIESGHVQRDGQQVWLTPKGRTHARALVTKVEFGRVAA